MPSPLPDSEVERILVVTAHPDDVDFGAAGSASVWTRAGIEVTYCICTDGQAGGFDDDVDRADIPAIRRREQAAAAVCVGVHDVRFLGYVDGELLVTRELVRDVTRVIRQVRPQRVLTQSPERSWEFIGRSHPDHLAAGEACTRAVYPAARNPYAFPELRADEDLEAWTVSELWLMAHTSMNRVVDITDTFDDKMKALLCHESQHVHPDQLEPRLQSMLRRTATANGLPDGRLAEGFFVVDTR